MHYLIIYIYEIMKEYVIFFLIFYTYIILSSALLLITIMTYNLILILQF